MLFKIVLHVTAFLPSMHFPDAKANHKFALLIPARNESKVIRQLLESIQNQSYAADMVDTYVIVESKNDPTCQIVKEFPRTHVIVREHLELKGKGYALDEALGQILPQKKGYEAYFIFDADNILDPNFLFEMNKVYDQGWEMALGYRNSKNWNDNWISACSGITFSAFSTFDNKPRARLGFGIHVSGTGFYIAANIIEKLGGWKFFTLTEDYEFTMYATLNNVKSTYNENAKFYDEQPTKLKQSWHQRVRWVKGFEQANKKYAGKLLEAGLKDKGAARLDKLMLSFGVIPLITAISTIICYIVMNLIFMIVGLCLQESAWYLAMVCFLSALFALYIFLVLYTSAVLLAERKNIDIRPCRAIVCILMNPFFMLLYIPIAISALSKKEVKWVAIEHDKIVPTPVEKDKK